MSDLAESIATDAAATKEKDGSTTQSGEPDEPVEDRPHERYTEGDCVLISSDRVIFKIQIYHVQSASTVLREAMTQDPEAPETYHIEFDDKNNETADIVTLFLDHITGYLASSHGADVDKARKSLKFARKWDSPNFSQRVLSSLAIRMYHDGKIHPYDIFLIGAEFYSSLLCAAAIRRGGTWGWVSPEEGSIGQKWAGGDRTGRSSMIPTFWHCTDFLINPRYTWALIMATQKWQGTGSPTVPTDAEWAQMQELTKRQIRIHLDWSSYRNAVIDSRLLPPQECYVTMSIPGKQKPNSTLVPPMPLQRQPYTMFGEVGNVCGTDPHALLYLCGAALTADYRNWTGRRGRGARVARVARGETKLYLIIPYHQQNSSRCDEWTQKKKHGVIMRATSELEQTAEPREEIAYPAASLDKNASVNPCLEYEETMFNHRSASTSLYTQETNEKAYDVVDMTTTPTTNQRLSNMRSSLSRTARDLSDACKSAAQATTEKMSNVSRNAVYGVVECCTSDGCGTVVITTPAVIVAGGLLTGIGKISVVYVSPVTSISDLGQECAEWTGTCVQQEEEGGGGEEEGEEEEEGGGFGWPIQKRVREELVGVRTTRSILPAHQAVQGGDAIYVGNTATQLRGSHGFWG
ncbi:hypothetical protein TREMEDRAFT_62945 [Tremella mesenterica DSM 1558]|uniref:uncharacterized protein n=1 Tax=Tremella mesenterica (strain ATCC 24925 / CBS 8224 / DSM 1558 / NBRC 9311 / NRRL Y-6157 / RJB 2259-6 / UBC 559-6) TaxID=578456 RepID=UPI0003F49859|nr:uncharacterized protein TREMEDRAFT_62945 [Tremella mesenterica DSM 1558]EIW69215.1 hypothetical protein TREMEDRAFT_62945 [Tremella mesenterica DSM 1558]